MSLYTVSRELGHGSEVVRRVYAHWALFGTARRSGVPHRAAP
ncbi:MAG: hypothetical protein ACRDTJ_00895 [Pseudonocardiaceae bacterium]